MLKKVVVTGADHHLNINSMVELHDKYPFVEWGLNFSKDDSGNKLSPLNNWIKDLNKISDIEHINLSAFLYEEWADDFISGNPSFIEENEFSPMFQRLYLMGDYSGEYAIDNFLENARKNFYYDLVIPINGDDYFFNAASYMAQNIFPCHNFIKSKNLGNIKWKDFATDKYTGYYANFDYKYIGRNIECIMDNTDQDVWIVLGNKVKRNGVIDFNVLSDYLKICKRYNG